ncbi:30S ribosomal protein S17 [Oceanotoga teriensis]|jgi:small subunit ribosomal protein S17|uniref:30S ribosomal protein S17 n=1 Tax=Oceanotoga teriensis TaxID=515440 RepID=UPI00271376B1|nr:30S ribosomal protein S17 [Oceanotoga teriensis]MDO7975639.1 30S ribosomal protein S17 [Oceanotoga teriensis]
MPKRKIIGKVVSDKMDKTIVVKVDDLVKHPVYKKTIKRSKKYHAHDEVNEASIGDIVEIEECRPISKTVKFNLIRVVKKDIFASEEETPETVEEILGGEN